MDDFFALLFLASTVCLTVGLLRPNSFHRFPYLKDRLTRKELAKFFGLILIGSFVMVGVTAESVVSGPIQGLPQSEETAVPDVGTTSSPIESDVNDMDEPVPVLEETNLASLPIQEDEVVAEEQVDQNDYYSVHRVIDGDTFEVIVEGKL